VLSYSGAISQITLGTASSGWQDPYITMYDYVKISLQ
jgi:hypothetical protein